MATAKKAPVKVAAKKAVPVAAKKAAAPAVKRFKPGQAVTGIASNGDKTTGKFVQYVSTPRGEWCEVNVGDKKLPVIKRYRPKAVIAA